MIETKISSSDIPTVEEFTPPRFKNWDKQLRFLVQIASLLAIALFFSNIFEEIPGFISDLLFVGLLFFFLMGLGVSFFQLRYINDKRNKITNLGGIIGLSGLLLTGIPCACEIGLEPVLYDLLSIFLPYILGLGLFLTIIGFFAEATQLDEMLIYTIRTNIRYPTTIIGAFLVNLGILVVLAAQFDLWISFWPQEIAGGWVTIIGVLIVWWSWFRYINLLIWNNRISILRTIYLSCSQVLVVLMIVIPLLLPQPLTPEIFLFRLLPIGIAGIVIIYGDYLKFGVPEQIRGFIKKYMLGIKGIVLICASALIMIGAVYQNFEEPVNTLFVISFRGFYSGVGLLLIYRMWFKAINNFITQSIQFLRTYYKEIVTLGAVILITLGAVVLSITEGDHFDVYLIPTFAILAGYLIAVVVWYFPKHSYSRGVNTSFSSVLLIWNLFMILNNIGLGTDISNYPSNLGLLIPGFLFVFYLGTDTYLWRKELYLALQQAWAFTKSKYREFMTAVGIGLMLVGSVSFRFFEFLEFMEIGYLNPYNLIPVVSFLFGYALIMIIWGYPRHPDYFRGIATSLSIIVFIWGLITVFTRGLYYFDIVGDVPIDPWPSIVSILYMGTGGVISAYLWQVELYSLLRRITKTIWLFSATYYRHFTTVIGLGLMTIGLGTWTGINSGSSLLFFCGYLLTVVIWHVRDRHAYFRGIATTLSVFVILLGLFFGSWVFDFSSISAILPLFVSIIYAGTGFVLPSYLWRKELIQAFRRITGAIKQFIETYYREFTTVIGLGSMAVGFLKWEGMVSFTSLLAFCGYLLAAVIWHVRDRHAYFRGITTTLSVVIIFWGLIFGSWAFDFSSISTILPLFVSIIYIGTGLVLPSYLWRVELWQLGKQIAQTVNRAFIITINAVINFVETSLRAIKKAFLAIFHSAHGVLLYFHRNLVSLVQYIQENFWLLVRYSLSVIGVLMISIGLFILLVPPAAEIGFLWMLLGFLLICGAWHENTILIIRAAGGYLRDVLTSVVKYADQAAKLLKAKFFALIEFGRVHFKAIAKTVTTLVGVLLVLFGLLGSFELLYVTGVPPSILILAGTIILYATWLSQVNEVLIRIARSIYGVFVAFSHYLWDTGVSIKDAVVSFFNYVLNYWKEILRAITTILSVLLISNGVFLGNLLFLVAGIVILYVTWFSQVNKFLNRTARSIYAALIAFGHYLWDVGVEIKDAVASFFTYVISLWREIVRAVATVIGTFLVIIGFFDLLDLRSDGNELLDIGLIFLGLVMISASWRSQIKEILIRTARSIYGAFVTFGHYIWDMGVEIKNTVVNFFRYVISLWRDIVRATATVIGSFLVIIGVFDLLYLRSYGNELLDIGLIFLGLVMISASWRSQIKELVIRYAKVLSNVLGQLIKTIGEISSRILKQLFQIVRTGFDSSITIAIVTLGVLALGYGLILLYSGLFDISGDWTADIIGIPIVGDIFIRLIGSFAQGRPFDLPSVTNLLGIWANAQKIVLNLVGVMFIAFGLLLPLFTLRKRDSIKISFLKRRFESSSSTRGQSDYEDKEGIK